MLIARGCKVNAKDINGRTPLHYAVDKGFEAVVEQLLRQRASVNAAEEEKLMTPLHLAITKGNKRIVELLLENDANPNLEDINGHTPLHMCVQQDDAQLCQLLLTFKAKMWKKEGKGASALHLACEKGKIAIVEVLLKEALPWMIKVKYLLDFKGLTPFHYAARGGHIRVIDALLDTFPICADWQDDLGRTYQHIAVAYRKPSCAQGSPLLNTLSHIGFNSYVNNVKYCDMVFIVDGRIVHAHQVICHQYPYFENLLATLPPGIGVPEIDLQEAKYDVFLEVLKYMYSGKIEAVPSSLARELAEAAKVFELPYLQRIITNSIHGDIGGSSSSSESDKKVNCFRRLRHSVNSPQYHDLELVCADKEVVFAHKVVCGRCPQFLKAFPEDTVSTQDGGGSDAPGSGSYSPKSPRYLSRERLTLTSSVSNGSIKPIIPRMKIPEHKAVVVAFMEIMYCGFIVTDLSVDDVLRLYHFIEKFHLDKMMEETLDVLEVVRNYLYDILSVESVVKIFGILSGEANSITELVFKFLAKKNVHKELAKNASVKSSVIFSNIMKNVKVVKKAMKSTKKEDLKEKDKKLSGFLKIKRREINI